jgi:hypothetical protein
VQLDESLDMGLELAKKMQHVMKHPEELPAMMSEAMDQLGVPAKDKAEVCLWFSQPECLVGCIVL